eukprot:2825829-Prymnesium_polylepis.3
MAHQRLLNRPFLDTDRKRGTGPPAVRRSLFGSAAGRRVGPGCRHRVRCAVGRSRRPPWSTCGSSPAC